jgi:hypothetical protein
VPAGPALPLPPPPRFLERAIPRQKGLAYLFGLVTSLAMGLLCYVVAVQVSVVLGTMLFVGLPFGMGFWTAFSVSYGRNLSAWAAIGYGLSGIGASLLLLLGFGWEGVACVVMAAPLLAAVGALGVAQRGLVPAHRLGAAAHLRFGRHAQAGPDRWPRPRRDPSLRIHQWHLRRAHRGLGRAY